METWYQHDPDLRQGTESSLRIVWSDALQARGADQGMFEGEALGLQALYGEICFATLLLRSDQLVSGFATDRLRGIRTSSSLLLSFGSRLPWRSMGCRYSNSPNTQDISSRLYNIR